MNEHNYIIRLSELERKFDRDKIRLAYEYVKTNAKHQVGDLIRDLHGGRTIIRVEQISIRFDRCETRAPEPNYLGPVCNVDGTNAQVTKHGAIQESWCVAYTPQSKSPELPQDTSMTYAVGYESNVDNPTFFAGPWPEMHHALEYRPDDWETLVDSKINIFILRENQSPEAIHEWDGHRWIDIVNMTDIDM